MLAVLDAKLAARGAPNVARSFLRTRAQARTAFVSIFRRFCYDRGKPEPQFSSASAVFRTLRTKLAPNARERRKNSKIDGFRPPKTSPGPSGRPEIEVGRPLRARNRDSRTKKLNACRRKPVGRPVERAKSACRASQSALMPEPAGCSSQNLDRDFLTAK